MKPGATTSPVASIVRRAVAGRQLPDRGDPIAADADVRAHGRRAGAVQHLPAANQQVKCGSLRGNLRRSNDQRNDESKAERSEYRHVHPPWESR